MTATNVQMAGAVLIASPALRTLKAQIVINVLRDGSVPTAISVLLNSAAIIAMNVRRVAQGKTVAAVATTVLLEKNAPSVAAKT